VTKDTESDIVQVASRGNYFNNFVTVDVSDDVIDIRCRNEVGSEPVGYNLDYEESGRLLISKLGNERTIEGSGQFALMDQSAPLLHFSFEEKLPLSTRSILGLGLIPGSADYKPKMKFVPVNNTNCFEVIPNIGEFGMDYDAQSAHVELVEGISGLAGKFEEKSRAAVWSMGPQFEGREISYSLWIKTNATDTPILISYEGYWIKDTVMNLRLNDGFPELVLSSTQRLTAGNHSIRLNDGLWHHIVVTNPADDSFLSDMKMYVDGEKIETAIHGENAIVTFPNGGVISLGGFGHGRAGTKDVVYRNERKAFMSGNNLAGLLDEVKIFARALLLDEVRLLYRSSSPAPSSLPSRSSAPTFQPSDKPSSIPSVKPTQSIQPSSTNNSQGPSEPPTIFPTFTPSGTMRSAVQSKPRTPTAGVNSGETTESEKTSGNIHTKSKRASTFVSVVSAIVILFT